MRLDLPLWPKQLLALQSPAQEVCYGGAAGPGKSHLARVASIRLCTEIPGFQMYLFRRTRPNLYLSHYVGPNSFQEMLAELKLAGAVTFSNLEIKFSNGSRIHGCHCFTGDTAIMTEEGPRSIESLVNRKGYVNISCDRRGAFRSVRKTRIAAEIVSVKFDDGSEVRCTPDHRFITTSGLVEARDLEGATCQTNELPFSTIRYRSSKGSDTRGRAGILDTAVGDYIARSGSILTERFRRATRFTTRIMIPPTTRLKTLKGWKRASIEGCTRALQKQEGAPERTLRALAMYLLSGIALQRESSGTNDSERKLSKTIASQKTASSVANGLWECLTRNSVVELVSRQSTILMGATAPSGGVQFAGMSSASIGLGQKKRAEKNAAIYYKHKRCVSVRAAGREDVYCMTVPEYGFLALGNGVLALNCEHENDIYNYKSTEMHGRIFEESTEFLAFQLQYAATRARYPENLRVPDYLRDILPWALYPTNWDDQGGSKEYLCELFRVYEHWNGPNRTEPSEVFTDAEGKTRQYIPGLLTDNPSIDYTKYVASLKQVRHPEIIRVLLEGDPTVVMGALLPELSSEQHVVPHFIPPPHWPRVKAHDWGSNAPAATVWGAISDGETVPGFDFYLPRGAVYIYKEWLVAEDSDKSKGLGYSNKQLAEGMYQREDQHGGVYLTDTLPFQARGGVPMWQDYLECGVTLQQADTSSKEVSVQALRSALVGNGRPMWYFSEDCPETFRTLAAQRPHDRKPEKPADHPEDHLPDCCYHIAREWKSVVDKPEPFSERVEKELNRRDTVADLIPEARGI